MKNLVFLTGFFFVFLQFNAQEKKEKIVWSENGLSISDFKGAPPEGVAYEGNTNSGISFTWNYSTQAGRPELSFEVVSNFYPQLSWIRDVENQDYLLAHEQLHFDISELYARKLRKALQNYEIARNIRRDLNMIYHRIEKQRQEMQDRFDTETNHSRNSQAEARWQQFVTEELKKLEDYKA